MGLRSWIATQVIEGKLPGWTYRLIGKFLAKKLDLEEDMTDQIAAIPGSPAVAPDTKPWYKSKTVWAAIITAFIGAVQPVSTALGHPYQFPLWMTQVLMGLGMYGLRTADTTITR